MMVTPDMTLEEFIAAGGDPDDPFTPTRFRRDGGAGAARGTDPAAVDDSDPSR
ncbi:hypothetical protein [Mycolicibacterium fortuitum]|uniref:hypothetical protein n=1 Tax=Mycolicibacterium fortuitum TaxID=1766 RepID=UPI00260CDBC4|nr:hypothetical protein [Mycolicibacterium fortuitum]